MWIIHCHQISRSVNFWKYTQALGNYLQEYAYPIWDNPGCLIYNETWILHSLNIHFPCFYVHYQSCENFHENVKFFFEYTFVLPSQFLDYTLKLGINWQSAVVLSTFNWKSGTKMICRYNFYLIIRFVQWTNLASLPAVTCLFLQHGSGAWTIVSSSAWLLPCMQCVTWKVSTTCPSMNTQWLPSIVMRTRW
jgi:hypothetical protein